MNLYMSSAEYQALMKEMGYTTTSSQAGRGNNGNNAPLSKSTDDIMMGQLILRLDEKWERFTANVAVQVLELGREVVSCFRIVAYATSICLVLYGTSCLVNSLRADEKSRRQQEK